MHARFSRPLSHVPLVRVLALCAWLAMVCVPVVVQAAAFAPSASMHGAAMQGGASVHAGHCCSGHDGGGKLSTGQCDACAASLTGLVLPGMPELASEPFAAPRWPTLSPDMPVRLTAPPLRPPRG